MIFHKAGRMAAAGLALTASLAAMPSAEAQDRPRDRQRFEQRGDPQQFVERRVAMLTERLQLNSTQAARVREILTQEQRHVMTLRPARSQERDSSARRDWEGDAGRAARDSVRARMQAIRERSDRQIESLLTEQQRTTYRELRDARGKGWGRHPQRGAA